MSVVHVAVGVIFDSSGRICIAKRPPGKHLSGLWEFPGGKVEPGESTFQTLRRELEEELAIQILSSVPLIEVTFSYPEKQVLLDVHSVHEFSGIAEGRENQEIAWVEPKDLACYTFPDANRQIVEAILGSYSPSW